MYSNNIQHNNCVHVVYVLLTQKIHYDIITIARFHTAAIENIMNIYYILYLYNI